MSRHMDWVIAECATPFDVTLSVANETTPSTAATRAVLCGVLDPVSSSIPQAEVKIENATNPALKIVRRARSLMLPSESVTINLHEGFSAREAQVSIGRRNQTKARLPRGKLQVSLLFLQKAARRIQAETMGVRWGSYFETSPLSGATGAGESPNEGVRFLSQLRSTICTGGTRHRFEPSTGVINCTESTASHDRGAASSGFLPTRRA
jgi:hypothetical protein